MPQSKEQLNNFYRKEDPWDYKTTPDDISRKEKILNMIKRYGEYGQALEDYLIM